MIDLDSLAQEFIAPTPALVQVQPVSFDAVETDGYTALYDFDPELSDEVQLVTGERVTVDLTRTRGGSLEWTYVSTSNGSGWVPKSFLTSLHTPSRAGVEACFEFIPETDDELSLIVGDVVTVDDFEMMRGESDEWWFGRSVRGQGWFPCSYVTKL